MRKFGLFKEILKDSLVDVDIFHKSLKLTWFKRFLGDIYVRMLNT